MLEGRAIVSLATIQEDGYPHVVPMWCLFDEGQIYIPTSHSTLKVRNLRKQNRAAILVHVASGGMSLRGAMIQGSVRIIEGEQARRWNRAIHQRYLEQSSLDEPAIGGYLAQDDVTLVLTPERVRSWDLSDLEHAPID